MNEPKVCIRINLAGKEYKDKQGKLWYAISFAGKFLVLLRVYRVNTRCPPQL